MAEAAPPDPKQEQMEDTAPSPPQLPGLDDNALYGGESFPKQSIQIHPLFPIPILEDIPMTNKELVMETYELREYKKAKKRIQDLRATNLTNDQIILLFVGSIDATGKIWYTDCNLVDRAVYFLLRKLDIGGYFLKIHVGSRNQWLDSNNPWRIDKAYHVTSLPTLMVCDTNQRLTGRRCFDVECLYVLLRD